MGFLCKTTKRPDGRVKTVFKKIFILLFFIPTSCAINPVTGRQELMLISETQEIEFGREAVPSANWEFGGHYHDPATENRT